MIRQFTLSITLSLFGLSAICQELGEYRPMSSYDSTELQAYFESNLRKEFKSCPNTKHRSRLKIAYKQRADQLITLANNEEFILDDRLNKPLDELVKELRQENPDISFPSKILISRSLIVNAFCTGEGTIVLNLGLLHQLNSRDMIAFVIAHEIAHHSSDHVNENILRYIKSNATGRDNREIQKRLKNGDRINTYKSIVYEDFKYHQSRETEADSLGLTYLANVDLEPSLFLEALNQLDSSQVLLSDTIPDLKSFLDVKNYPFKDKWLLKDDGGLVADEESAFIFDKDSIRSHPEIEERILFMKKLMGNYSDTELEITPLFDEYMLNQEVVASSMKAEFYGWSLLYALQIDDDSKFVKNAIASSLFKLFEARKLHTYGKSVPSVNFESETDEFFTILNNLRLRDLANYSYYYLNQSGTFDSGNEDHYYFLHTVAKYLKKEEVAFSVKKRYDSNFQDKKYNLN